MRGDKYGKTGKRPLLQPMEVDKLSKQGPHSNHPKGTQKPKKDQSRLSATEREHSRLGKRD